MTSTTVFVLSMISTLVKLTTVNTDQSRESHGANIRGEESSTVRQPQMHQTSPVEQPAQYPEEEGEGGHSEIFQAV